MIAAASSGSGKTTLTTGLIRALSDDGVTVAPFKVGPDYIDPGYHGVAARRVGRNLDAVMCGEEILPALYAHGSAGCDIALVEGVMGLFDGRIGRSEDDFDPLGYGSTAHVAATLGLPVVLVMDTSGVSQTLAALVHGLASYDSRVRIVGVILNKVATPRHEAILTRAISALGIPVVGSLARRTDIAVPSRHLGLVTATEHGAAAESAIAGMAELTRAGIDLQHLQTLAAPPQHTAPAWQPGAFPEYLPSEHSPRPRIVLFGGAAFSFAYAELTEVLATYGAEILTIDPMRDTLPDHTSGVIIPGGFPEEHAADLAANTALHAQVRDLAAAGGVIYGECGGLLYLSDSLDGHAMAGVVSAQTAMQPRLRLGYREAVALTPTVFGPEGSRMVGHEFHRTGVTTDSPTTPVWGWQDFDGSRRVDGAVGYDGRVVATYLHTHPVAAEAGWARFVAAARHHAGSIRTASESD